MVLVSFTIKFSSFIRTFESNNWRISSRSSLNFFQFETFYFSDEGAGKIERFT